VAQVGGLEAAENVLPRLAHVVGKVYKKKQVRLFFIQKGSERRRDFVKMEKFFYECIRSAEHLPTRTVDDNAQPSES
jgi:hypothetical protein